MKKKLPNDPVALYYAHEEELRRFFKRTCKKPLAELHERQLNTLKFIRLVAKIRNQHIPFNRSWLFGRPIKRT